MENFKIVHNVETNEIEQVSLTASEIAQKAKDVQEAERVAQLVADHKAAKAALLEKLGISEDEAKLLLG
jgi:hypothetical protein